MGLKLLVLVLIGAFCARGIAQDNSVVKNWGGGIIIPRSQFPAVIPLEIQMQKDPSKKGFCTGTLIGPQVVLTAAHCAFEKFPAPNATPHFPITEDRIPPNKSARFVLAGKEYRFQFINHAQTDSEIDEGKNLDVAIGILNEPIVDIQPITINMSNDHGKKMMVLGYGCSAELSLTFMQKTEEMEHLRYLVSSSKQDVHICPGDSGGPSLAYTSTDSKLQLIGIHKSTNGHSVSIDTRTDSKKFIDFISDIADQKNLQICGYNLICE